MLFIMIIITALRSLVSFALRWSQIKVGMEKERDDWKKVKGLPNNECQSVRWKRKGNRTACEGNYLKWTPKIFVLLQILLFLQPQDLVLLTNYIPM